jgi:hypothetical protein
MKGQRAKSSMSRPSRKITTKPSRRLSFKRLLLIYGFLIIAAAVAALLVANQQVSATLPDPFRPEQRNAVIFPLYYPTHLPEGMEVDAGSLGRLDSSIVSMRITEGRGSLGRSFSMTEQAAPKAFDFGTFYSSFTDKTSFETKLGTVTTGTIDNGATRIASLVANKETWILIQAPPSIRLDELKDVLEHLAVSH